MWYGDGGGSGDVGGCRGGGSGCWRGSGGSGAGVGVGVGVGSRDGGTGVGGSGCVGVVVGNGGVCWWCCPGAVGFGGDSVVVDFSWWLRRLLRSLLKLAVAVC